MYAIKSVDGRRAAVPEELQVVPAVVEETLLIPLQAQPLEPLPHR